MMLDQLFQLSSASFGSGAALCFPVLRLTALKVGNQSTKRGKWYATIIVHSGRSRGLVTVGHAAVVTETAIDPAKEASVASRRCRARRAGFGGSQGTQQVGAADDANNAPIAHDRTRFMR
jgi:hypothetical protein